MSPGNYPGKLRNRKGMGVTDAPFMILAAVLLTAFAAYIGLYITNDLLETTTHATAIDSSEKIYNAARMLSAGAPESTRTLWIKLPEEYALDFDGNLTLKYASQTLGSMRIDGVEFKGDSLRGGGKRHLKLTFYVESGSSRIRVEEET